VTGCQTMLQLNPPLPVEILGKGKGFALVLLDYGPEWDLIWVCLLDSGEMWAAANSKLRGQANWTLGRQGGDWAGRVGRGEGEKRLPTKGRSPPTRRKKRRATPS